MDKVIDKITDKTTDNDLLINIITIYENKEFDDKVKSTIYFIKNCIDKYNLENIAISFNGGKDCTVLLYFFYMIFNSLKDINIVYFQQNDEFREITDFIQVIVKKFGINLITIKEDNFKSGIVQLMKIKPIKAIFMGQRIIDPHCLSLQKECNSDVNFGYPAFIRINPLLDWNYQDIWQFLLKNKCDYCKLYDFGYTSIGNQLNTMRNKKLWNSKLESYKPAYCLENEQEERIGRI